MIIAISHVASRVLAERWEGSCGMSRWL